MDFVPLKDKDRSAKQLPTGIYYFEVIEATEKVSRNGNRMIELALRITDGNGLKRTLTDYLFSTIRPKKLCAAAMACGLVEAYDTGRLSAEDFLGKSGRVKVGIEAAKDPYPSETSSRTTFVLKKPIYRSRSRAHVRCLLDARVRSGKVISRRNRKQTPPG